PARGPDPAAPRARGPSRGVPDPEAGAAVADEPARSADDLRDLAADDARRDGARARDERVALGRDRARVVRGREVALERGAAREPELGEALGEARDELGRT